MGDQPGAVHECCCLHCQQSPRGEIAEGHQDVISGIAPGQQVVNDALALSAEAEQ